MPFVCSLDGGDRGKNNFLQHVLLWHIKCGMCDQQMC